MNCQKNNLRIATKTENGIHQRKVKRKTLSKYKGVGFIDRVREIKSKNKIYKWREKGWFVQLTYNGCQKRKGVFKTEDNAATAFNILAEKYYGEFAVFNK